MCYIQINNLSQAESDLRIALNINSTNLKANRRLYTILLRTGRLKEAKLYLNRCYNIDDQNKNSIKIEQETLDKLIELDYQVKKEYQNHKYSQCEKYSTEILSHCSDYYDMKTIQVESLLITNKLEKAVNILKSKFTDDEKLNETTVYLTALAFYYEGKYDKAKTLLHSLIQTTKNKKDKYEKLLSILSSIEAVKSSATECYKKGNYEEAVIKYDLILKVDDTNKNLTATIYSNMALCKHKRKKLNEALNYINLSIANNASYVKAYFRRGLINMDIGDFDSAELDFKKVLELDASSKDAKLKLDEIEMEKEKRKRKDYYKILDINASSGDMEIRQAYKKLAAKHHPDKNSGDEKTLEKALIMFKDITEAYEVLSDKQKRAMYDNGNIINDNMNDEESANNDELLYKRAEEIYYKNKTKNKNYK